MQYVEKELAPDTKIPIRIGFIKPNGVPSIISLWYIDINGKIYCATQKTAKIFPFISIYHNEIIDGTPFGLMNPILIGIFVSGVNSFSTYCI